MKRLLALLLACLLLSGAALADAADDIPVEAAVEAAPELPPFMLGEGEELSRPNDAEAPALLSVTKSATKTLWLGTVYQIEVPGRTVAGCRSSAKKVAAVTAAGLVTPKKTGTAKLTVTLAGGKQLTVTAKVKDPTVPAKVVIDGEQSATLSPGETLNLTAAVRPATAPQDVTWTSANLVVAGVDGDGTVTARRNGVTTITAATANGKRATFTLTVRRPADQVTAPFMISHAMGGIDGLAYTNCLEAFEQNYAEGHRVFEVDIETTSDGRLVLWHDWGRKICAAHKPGYQASYAQFMGAKINDRYTPVSIEDLLRLMAEHPDIRVITDTKTGAKATVRKQFRALVQAAKQTGTEEVLSRFIVQIYTRDMFWTVERVHHFDSYIFTLYKLFNRVPTKAQFKSVADFCGRNGIGMITMKWQWWDTKYLSALRTNGVDVALHTVNDAKEAKAYLSQGVTALYTDALPPV